MSERTTGLTGKAHSQHVQQADDKSGDEQPRIRFDQHSLNFVQVGRRRTTLTRGLVKPLCEGTIHVELGLRNRVIGDSER